MVTLSSEVGRDHLRAPGAEDVRFLHQTFEN
jgi:hypothetical protein